MRDGRLLGRHAEQAVRIVVVAQRDGKTAHYAPIPGRAARILLIRQATGFERILATIDECQGAFGGQPNPPPIHFHPFHPALGDVVGVEGWGREQRLAQQERHGGVVVVRRVLRRGREVGHSARERSTDRVGRPELLRRNTQLISGDKTQQGASRARDELWVSTCSAAVHWATS